MTATMTRIAAVLRDNEDFLAEHGVYGIAGIITYITADGYGRRYDADNPLPVLAARIGRTGARVAGVHRRGRVAEIRNVSESRVRAGNLLLDIANTIDSLLTGGEPVGAVRV